MAIEDKVITSNRLKDWSIEEIKQEVLRLTEGRDTEPLSQKVVFHKNELAPLFEELSQRNPFPQAEAQVPIVLGAWSPVWSTIPFQDSIPGRLREQSYQIFHDDGYYANIARYAPGNKLPLLQKLSSILIAYDLMLVQKFEVLDGQWHIQNVGIEQDVRMGAVPLNLSRAEEWFTTAVKSKFQGKSHTDRTLPQLNNLDKSSAKRFQKAFLAIPQFEHLYIDPDFRIVKSRREVKQRPSYTITVRR